jgi:replication factor C subunit 1
MEISNNRNLGEFFGAGRAGDAPRNKRTLVIMDEVDGMGGGDRGGNQELIALIKKTRVPVICICNDRQKTRFVFVLFFCFSCYNLCEKCEIFGQLL